MEQKQQQVENKAQKHIAQEQGKRVKDLLQQQEIVVCVQEEKYILHVMEKLNLCQVLIIMNVEPMVGAKVKCNGKEDIVEYVRNSFIIMFGVQRVDGILETK